MNFLPSCSCWCKHTKGRPGLKTDLGLNPEQKLIFSASGGWFGTAHLHNHHFLWAEEGDVCLCPLCQQGHQAHQRQATRHSSTHAHPGHANTHVHIQACMRYNGGWRRRRGAAVNTQSRISGATLSRKDTWLPYQRRV